MAERSKLLIPGAALVVGLVIGGLTGYFSTSFILGPGTGTGRTMKAGFIYVGPVGDIGWTHAHDYARQILEDKFDWLETSYVESVPEGEALSYIDNLVATGSEIVFTTSFGFMDPTETASINHPDELFFHCSGFKRTMNMGTYFAEFHQLYFLNGLMAGALTQTDNIGYVAAFLIPEVVRHLNAFILGARFINPNVTLHVRVISAWYDPTAARNAAQAMVTGPDNVDILAFTEDSSAIVEYAQEQYDLGNDIYAFAHYSPMLQFGTDVAVSGQLVHWEVIYEDILSKVYAGAYNTTNLGDVDYWWMLKEGAVELGADFGVPINPVFQSNLTAVPATDPLTNKSTNAYDLVLTLNDYMSTERVLFEPFTGPINYQNGSLWLPAGIRATYDDLWGMDFYLEGVDLAAPSI
ncbi:MAG: BMP family ABC transporter substrate-binding protein [Promethearchaeota archaeon]|jgi:simple sugar transport system substrate-binding protein